MGAGTGSAAGQRRRREEVAPELVVRREPLPELTEAQRSEIAARVALFKELMPEHVQTVRDLVAAGMMSGWRGLVSVRRITPKEP